MGSLDNVPNYLATLAAKLPEHWYIYGGANRKAGYLNIVVLGPERPHPQSRLQFADIYIWATRINIIRGDCPDQTDFDKIIQSLASITTLPIISTTSLTITLV